MPREIKRSGWLTTLNTVLRPEPRSGFRVLDLYCGAGGLSLGFRACGFDVIGVDHDRDASHTYKRNFGDSIFADLDAYPPLPQADVIIAGPPCQPWSRAGKRLGENDDRDGLNVILRSVAKVHPNAVVVENVPELAGSKNRQHLDQFEAELTDLDYVVSEHTLNAADYGVPQSRRRVFIVAARGDQHIGPPSVWQGEVTVRQALPGTYKRYATGARIVSERMGRYIERYERASGCRTPRDLHVDRPSRTLTVRNLSGATGDMIRLRMPDGERRMLTTREAARLQSFPDWFKFTGSERSRMQQIGNAVPPLLAHAVATTIHAYMAAYRSMKCRSLA